MKKRALWGLLFLLFVFMVVGLNLTARRFHVLLPTAPEQVWKININMEGWSFALFENQSEGFWLDY